MLRDIGKFAEAISAFKSAREIYEQLTDANPKVTVFQTELARCHHNMGTLFSDTGKPAEALAACRSALAIQQKLVHADPTATLFQRDLAGSYFNIGVLLVTLGKPNDALNAFESGSRSVRRWLTRTRPPPHPGPSWRMRITTSACFWCEPASRPRP